MHFYCLSTFSCIFERYSRVLSTPPVNLLHCVKTDVRSATTSILSEIVVNQWLARDWFICLDKLLVRKS